MAKVCVRAVEEGVVILSHLVFININLDVTIGLKQIPFTLSSVELVIQNLLNRLLS